jgi:hypothetical protein
MQQDALVPVADAEGLANLLRTAAGHVPQGDHRSLRRGQVLDGVLNDLERLV